MKKVRSKLHPTEIGAIKTFSLSPNDEIGEIAVECSGCTYYYNNLAELCEKWEDYEEPKDIWWLDNEGCVNHASGEVNDNFRKNRKIGNYFLSREEAEKAVEKLKAWKRLKDKGFRFDGYDVAHNGNSDLCGQLFYNAGKYCIGDVEKDLDLLFGGEE